MNVVAITDAGTAGRGSGRSSGWVTVPNGCGVPRLRIASSCAGLSPARFTGSADASNPGTGTSQPSPPRATSSRRDRCAAGPWKSIDASPLGNSGQVRTFRVDRVSTARLAGVGFDPPEGFDPVQHVARSLAAVPYTHEVEVVLATTLDNAQRRIPPTAGTLAETDGGILLTARVEHLPGAAVMLAGLGWPFTVRRPAALRDEVRALAGRLQNWSDEPRPVP